MKQKREKHVYKVKRANKPVQVFNDLDSIDKELKPVFDRLEAELEGLSDIFDNPEIKKQFDEMEKELNRMELKFSDDFDGTLPEFHPVSTEGLQRKG